MSIFQTLICFVDNRISIPISGRLKKCLDCEHLRNVDVTFSLCPALHCSTGECMHGAAGCREHSTPTLSCHAAVPSVPLYPLQLHHCSAPPIPPAAAAGMLQLLTRLSPGTRGWADNEYCDGWWELSHIPAVQLGALLCLRWTRSNKYLFYWSMTTGCMILTGRNWTLLTWMRRLQCEEAWGKWVLCSCRWPGRCSCCRPHCSGCSSEAGRGRTLPLVTATVSITEDRVRGGAGRDQWSSLHHWLHQLVLINNIFCW